MQSIGVNNKPTLSMYNTFVNVLNQTNHNQSSLNLVTRSNNVVRDFIDSFVQTLSDSTIFAPYLDHQIEFAKSHNYPI